MTDSRRELVERMIEATRILMRYPDLVKYVGTATFNPVAKALAALDTLAVPHPEDKGEAMPDTHTPRLRQIADDLREQGAYTSANSVDEITSQRDDLLMLALPFCNITEQATASLGQVTPEQVNNLRETVHRICVEAEQWIPK